jgi:hypothetical protein
VSSRFVRSLAAAALLASVGCGNNNSSGTGILEVQLVDAPTDSVKSIFVTIDSVTAHSDQAGWVNVFHGPLTVDLLTLKETSMKLGQVTLPAGTVSQVRFLLVDGGPQYVVLNDGSQAPLKVPSGTESGVKLNGPFTVSACTKHILVLDFDGMHSIEYHETGQSPPIWILRPVIRVKAEADEPESCHPAGGSTLPDGGDGGGGSESPDAGANSPDAGSPGDYPPDGGNPYPYPG